MSTIEEELRFDLELIAAASLGQVHRACLNGQEVVLKVQRSGLKELFDIDVKSLMALVFTNIKIKKMPDMPSLDGSEVVRAQASAEIWKASLPTGPFIVAWLPCSSLQEVHVERRSKNVELCAVMPQSSSSWMSVGAETAVPDGQEAGQPCRVGCQGEPGAAQGRSGSSTPAGRQGRRGWWHWQGTSTGEKAAGLGWPVSCKDGAARLGWLAAAREKRDRRIIVSSEQQQR